MSQLHHKKNILKFGIDNKKSNNIFYSYKSND